MFEYLKTLFNGLNYCFFAGEGEGGGNGGEGDGDNTGSFNTDGDLHFAEMDEAISSNADHLAFAKRYNNLAEFVKGAYETKQKLGSSFRLPDDLKTLSDEQRAEIVSKAVSLRDVPENAEGYEYEIPDGLTKDEALDTAFRAFAHEHKMSKSDVKEIMSFYHQAQLSAMQKHGEDVARKVREAETQFRVRCGADYDKVMENIKRARMQVTEKLGLGYTNDKGELSSKLDDCLDKTGLGNKIPILQLLNLYYEDVLAEGEPIGAESGSEGQASSFFNYDKVDK